MKRYALIVEDDDDWRQNLADQCRLIGDEVVAVGTVDDAKAELQRRPYAYMLVDLGLPVCKGGRVNDNGGQELVLWQRGREGSGPSLPVIMVTAQDDDYRIVTEAFVEARVGNVWKKLGRRGSLTQMIHKLLQPAAPAPPARDGRVFATALRLHLDGQLEGRRFAVVVDDRPVLVRDIPFKLLVELAVALQKGDDFVSLRSREHRHKEVAWLRQDLRSGAPPAPRRKRDAQAGDEFETVVKRLLENDARGGYRLSTRPEHVSANPNNLVTHHRALMTRLGGWLWSTG